MPFLEIRLATLAAVLAGAMALSACGSGLFGSNYEYEEEVRLDVDGTAQLNVNASVPALVALRGADLDPNPEAEVDRARVRALFEGPGVEVTSVRTSRRRGRRFVHVRLDVKDIRQLSKIAPFSWSHYELNRRGTVLEYRQVVGMPSGRDVGNVGWDGSELVAFRVHVPSVILFHNAPSKRVERGNILEWPQPLSERLKGVPVDLEINMEPRSMLLLFGATIVLAAAVFGLVIWRVARHGRDADAGAGQPASPAE
jgi:hypothetical protein